MVEVWASEASTGRDGDAARAPAHTRHRHVTRK